MILEHNTAIQIFPIIESDIGFNHLGTYLMHNLIKWSNKGRERETNIVKVNVIFNAEENVRKIIFNMW